MKCNDIEKILTSDTGDLGGVSRHLDICSSCAKKYAADLEMELALRRLSSESGMVDITGDLKATLYQPYMGITRLKIIRRWVWIATSMIAAMVIIVNLPTILNWLESGYNYYIANIPAPKISNPPDIKTFAKEVESSFYYSYIVIMVLAFFAGISAYLWREFKEVVR